MNPNSDRKPISRSLSGTSNVEVQAFKIIHCVVMLALGVVSAR
jgi:hypothetical protein